MDSPSLPGFVEWLSRKDPNERYEWPKADICACGQYSASLGKKEWLGTGSSTWSRLNMIARGGQPNLVAAYDTSDSKEWTFGKCLERAKKELAHAV